MGLSSKDTDDGDVRMDDVGRLVGLDDDDVTSLLPVSSITTGGGGLENVVSLVEFLFPPRSPWCSTSVNKFKYCNNELKFFIHMDSIDMSHLQLQAPTFP